MATTIPSSSPLVSFLQKHRPKTLPSGTTEASGYTSHDLIQSAYPDIHYTEHEKEEISSWLSTSQHIGSTDEDAAKHDERLSTLNRHLSTRTTNLGSKPSIADLAIYSTLAPVVNKWSDEQRTGEQGYHHIVRHLLFVQASPKLGLQLSDSDRLNIDEDKIVAPIKPIDAKAEKERKKREKEAAAAADQSTTEENEAKKDSKQKKSTGDTIAAAIGSSVPVASDNTRSSNSTPQTTTTTTTTTTTDGTTAPPPAASKPKKEKPPKQKKAPEPAKETPLTPALIDLRVGHILKAIQHPNADSLYVSTIAVGDPAGTENTSEYEGKVCRTVCSGLNGLVPLEEMQGRKVVAVCNLKPVTMRGIKSSAMVLAASPRLKEGEEDTHAGPVELVELPEGVGAGDRVSFQGWEGEPEGVLNPKKKVWDMCQVGFTTTHGGEVAFDPAQVDRIKEDGRAGSGLSTLVCKGKPCTVKTLKGATVR